MIDITGSPFCMEAAVIIKHASDQFIIFTGHGLALHMGAKEADGPAAKEYSQKGEGKEKENGEGGHGSSSLNRYTPKLGIVVLPVSIANYTISNTVVASFRKPS
jgi:hypothetical protein